MSLVDQDNSLRRRPHSWQSAKAVLRNTSRSAPPSGSRPYRQGRSRGWLGPRPCLFQRTPSPQVRVASVDAAVAVAAGRSAEGGGVHHIRLPQWIGSDQAARPDSGRRGCRADRGAWSHRGWTFLQRADALFFSCRQAGWPRLSAPIRTSRWEKTACVWPPGRENGRGRG